MLLLLILWNGQFCCIALQSPSPFHFCLSYYSWGYVATEQEVQNKIEISPILAAIPFDVPQPRECGDGRQTVLHALHH